MKSTMNPEKSVWVVISCLEIICKYHGERGSRAPMFDVN